MNNLEKDKIIEAINWLNNSSIIDEFKIKQANRILCETLRINDYSDLFNNTK